ncbi:hypothetical protein [Tumebacillus lipolyticus]|uniref:Uncharacterized protein n=1 Tax=Tumebacillus lipolyticus TaxID=1280370 RepID=A0ABW4ZZW4_9BACL
MKHLGLQVGLGVFGFILATGLSLIAGNSMLTSMTRGLIGLFGLFLLGYLCKLVLRLFVGELKKDEVLGQHIDLLLPEQAPTEQVARQQEASERSADREQEEELKESFVPLHHALTKRSPTEEEARNMAEALRHLKELN